MLSNAFRRILTEKVTIIIAIAESPAATEKLSLAYITRKTRKGETHQKVELIFHKVSGSRTRDRAEHNNIINVEVFFFIFQSQGFHMRFNAEFLESFSIRNLIMHLCSM